MTESIYNLYTELLELATSQKEAILKGRYEEAEKFYRRRVDIIDKMQHINGEGSPSDREEFSGQIPVLINKIFSVDNDMKTIIQKKMKSLSERLEDIRKVKAFCRNAAAGKARARLDINI